MISAEAIVPLSRECRSAAAVRAAVNFDGLVAANPMHEIFIMWFRHVPDAPFAVPMRISKARVAKDGLPLIVDPETRVCEVNRVPEPGDE
jgi:hypothetical protein